MSDLIAIGYPDEATADEAAAEARRLAQDLIIQPDAIAVIVRDQEGKYHTHTTHHMVGRGATWGMFWGLLFGLLFFIPVLGMAVGAGMGALMGKVTKSGVDKAFQDQVRDLLQPGTSALFLMVEKVTPDKAVDAMSKYGGTVLKTSLSKEGEADLQDALHGGAAS
jgi:Predicted membrane protein